MPIVLVNTPSSVLADWIIKYNYIQLGVAAEAMSLYLKEDGQALLNLFMEPKTRALAADASYLLKNMPVENLHKFIDLVDDHLQKAADQTAQAEEAEYHAEIQAWVERNPEARL